jgi:hypothetical protein
LGRVDPDLHCQWRWVRMGWVRKDSGAKK